MIRKYKEHGEHAFSHYIIGFDPFDSDEGIADLAWDMMQRFEMIGFAAAHHFLINFDFPVVKPDVNRMRTFCRIGLIRKMNDPLGTLVAARRLARAADVPVSWVDNFVNLGMKRGNEVCGTTMRCVSCDIRPLCRSKAAQETNRALPL